MCGKNLVFMLDSGASCNFLSATLFRTLGVSFDSQVEYSVRLADGNMVKTYGKTTLHVDFGATIYSGTFHVVPGSIPLILGM